MADDAPVGLSIRFLRGVRAGEPTDGLREAIADLDPDAIEALPDRGRKAFWLNLYNAVVQRRLAEEPSAYESKRRFFGADAVTVGGRALSLDDVEHGMLRRSMLKLGMGYVPHPFPGSFERRLRVEERDPRIHFALNCGAESCPPIAAYTAEGIEDELDLATASYLETEVRYDPDRGVVRVPRLFLWFRGDFGGKSGILALLREHDLVPEDARPRLKHDDYDWSPAPGRYRESPPEVT